MRHQWLVAAAALALPLSVPTAAIAQSNWQIKRPPSVPTAGAAQSSWRIQKSLLIPASANAQPTWHIESTRPAKLSSEALKSTALKWEIAYLALSAVDTAQTVHCLRRDICEEVNPLFGKRPSTKTIILTKVGGGVAHFALFSYINERNPRLALRAAQISVVGQGGVVMLNARVLF
jgi:hypothetical protein